MALTYLPRFLNVRRIGVLCFLALLPTSAVSQVQAPDSDEVFVADSDKSEDLIEKQREKILTLDAGVQGKVDFQAPEVEFFQDQDLFKGKGGVILSNEQTQVQADEGSYNVKTKMSDLSGNVVISSPEGSVTAETARYNLETELGEFSDAEFEIEDGAYRLKAEEAEKKSEFEYELSSCLFTTCSCSDGSVPWSFRGSDMDITEERYAHVRNAKFRVNDVPVLYTPWIAFPVKQERASGLLIPEFGYSSKDGVGYKQPLHVVLDDYSDMTFIPFLESQTRNGMGLEYRDAFSDRSSLIGKVVYSNERPRDGDLRGTDISNVFDPEIEDNRWGGYLQQGWSNDPSSDIPLSLVSDIHLVNDNLFGRELYEPEVVREDARYTTSRSVLRAGLGDYFSASLGAEYNQSLLTDQDLVFQRVPEFNLSGLRSFRPFGFSPYGLKLTSKITTDVVGFTREDGYEGFRYNIGPSVKIPVRYKNYVNSDLELQVYQTYYELSDATDPSDPSRQLDDSTERGLFRLRYSVGTEVERVFELEQGNWLEFITGLGKENKNFQLKRLKHTVEPTLRFDYVPGTSQSDLPVFDSFDRFRQRSLITYGFTTGLWGSFEPRSGVVDTVEEVLPQLEDLPFLDTRRSLREVDNRLYDAEAGFGDMSARQVPGRRFVRQLASFRVLQSFDYVEDEKDLDPDRRAFSDIYADLGVYPTNYFGVRASTNYAAEDQDVSSWALASHFLDDRGDRLRFRYEFIDQSISQVEGNLEIVLMDRLRAGYYARFDEEENEFVEQRGALRLTSACDCWDIDFGVSDEINPDRQKFLLTFRLRGLGDITQDFGLGDPDQRNGG
ncbi:MAG: LPS-assembly protein LptD [Bdellovibrionales bacterium]|nr:LPS-assembly protein LptD [Bdellovibrionales bacterium]